MSFRGWYEKKIMPPLITCACGQKEIDHLRAQIVPLAEGDVLEIGCGGGLNQRHYDHARLASFSGIDPNETLREDARLHANERGWETDIRDGVAEAIPFDGEAIIDSDELISLKQLPKSLTIVGGGFIGLELYEGVDPTGAGDSFAGGFMGYLSSQEKLDEAAMRRAMVDLPAQLAPPIQ